MKPIVTDTYDFPTLIESGYVYVDKTALKQCQDRNYATPYAAESRSVFYVGVNYDSKTACLEIKIGEVNGEVKKTRGEVNGEVNRIGGEVKSFVRKHPGCRRKDILSALRIAPRTLDRRIAELMNDHELEFRGAPKTGGYYQP